MVTPAGVLETRRRPGSGAGPAAERLLIGSEGILGVITEATLKLARLPGHLDVFLFALDDLPAVLALFRAARRGPFVVSAYEFFTDRCLARVERHRHIDAPFAAPSPCYVVLEVEAPARDRDVLDDWLAGLFEQGLVRDGVLAQTTHQARALWELREGISESLAATGLPHKNDVALAIADLDAFCGDLERVFPRRTRTGRSACSATSATATYTST